jgi:c-di-GMP-binding flagellar brake protein YcgR
MSDNQDVLTQAIERRQEGVITVRDGGVTHQITLRFAQEARQADQDGFWSDVLRGDSQWLEWLINAKATVEVSFNSPWSSVFFDSAVLAQRVRRRVPQAFLSKPQRLSIVQRRQDNREPVPQDIEMVAQLTRINHQEGPPCELVARVFDVSATGASFVCRADQPLPRLEIGEPLSILLVFNEVGHQVLASHRYTQRLSGTSVRIGVEFDKHEAASAQKFQQYLADLEELRVRRTFRSALTKTAMFTTS